MPTPLLCTQAMHYSVNVQTKQYTYVGLLCCLSWLYTANIGMLTQFAPFSCFDLLVLMLAIFVLCY